MVKKLGLFLSKLLVLSLLVGCSTKSESVSKTNSETEPAVETPVVEETGAIQESTNEDDGEKYELPEEKILKELDSRPFKGGVSKLLVIDASGSEWTASETYLRTFNNDGKELDELFIETSGDGGGVALIMVYPFGKAQFETDKLVRVERGLKVIGPSLNGRHYLTIDSIKTNDNGEYVNLAGERLEYTGSEYYASHIEYYSITDAGKIERVVWNSKWSSLDTLPKIKLMYTRNEVFARHGYKFKMSVFQDYFRYVDNRRYSQNSDNAANLLSAEEKKFVDYVKNLEDGKTN